VRLTPDPTEFGRRPAKPFAGNFSLLLIGLLVVLASAMPQILGQAPEESVFAYLPQVANGEFAGGRFRTTFVLTNTTALSIEVQIDLTADDGSPLTVGLADGDTDLGSDSTFTVVIPSGATRFLDTDAQGEGRVGAARLQSDGPLTVAAVFTILDSNGNLLTEGGVGDSQPQVSFVVPVDKAGAFNTGLALFNPDPGQPSQLTVRLFDLTGQAKNSPVQLTLAALQHRAKFVDEIFSGLGDFRGTVHVSADRPVAAMTLRQNFQPLGLTTLPVVWTGSTQTEFYLPHVADGSFSGGRIRTSFLLFALSNAGASAKLTLTADDGAPLAMNLSGQGAKSEFDLSVSANGSLFLESGGSGALSAGAARIVADKPIGVVAIFSILDEQGRLRTEAGVASARRLADLTLPVGTAASFDSGIAFFNLQASETTVVLALLDAEGAPASGVTARKTLKLQPHGHVAHFVTELFPGATQPFRGSVGILSSGEVAATTLRQNSAPLSFTTLPVGENAAQPIRGDGLVLNEVGFIPPAGQFPYLELKATQDGAWPAGLYLYNEAGQAYRLPTDLPALTKGEFLLVVFDGQNRIENGVVHADRTGYLNRASGFVLLINQNSQEIDHVGWGVDQAETVRLGRGGAFNDPEEGMSIGRIPGSDRPVRVEDWTSYWPGQTTPGQANLWPAVEALLPFAGAVSEDPVVDLAWYRVPGATAYRVQLARDIEFTQVLADQTTEAAPFRTASLQPGDYFWRVQAIFADQGAAEFSQPSVFSVETPVSALSAALPAQAGENPLGVPLISQRKDTAMLLLETEQSTGNHAWDKDHGEMDWKDPADEMNCGLASISMINAWFWKERGSPNKRLSQDRIGYEMLKHRAPGLPEWDLNYGRGLSWQGQGSEQTRALEWALKAPPTFKYFTTADAFWVDIQREIDNRRPILAVTALPGGFRSPHTVVITGYATGGGKRYVFANNPFFSSTIKGVSQFNLDAKTVHPSLKAVWAGYCLVSPNSVPREDEASIRTDTDRDGVVDFDEQERFHTHWANFPADRDTDQDEVLDKQDIYASIFGKSPLAYANHIRKNGTIRVSSDTSVPMVRYVVRPSLDPPDDRPMELDPDSDGGGCYDGFEDFNFDGIQQSNESSNLDKGDDFCHVKGEEVRDEDYRQSTSVSAKTDWVGKVTAKFCLGPLPPAQRSNPQAVAGRATVTWSATQTTVYSQLTGSGCQMPLTVRNVFQTTFNPVDNSGSVGPGPAKGSITLTFFPRPTGKAVTAQYSENPDCPFLKDDAAVWPDGSAIWGGVGWVTKPFDTRLTVPATGLKVPLWSFPVPQPGTGLTTLTIAKVARTEKQAQQPCQP